MQVFDDHGRLSHFVDASDEALRTWMCYVNCARNDQEQNLEVFQMGADIYYRALKVRTPQLETLPFIMHQVCLAPIEASRRNRFQSRRKQIIIILLHCKNTGVKVTPRVL